MTSKKRKIAWSEKEDNLLRDAVQRFGEGHWATIAKRGNFSVKRTAKQINQYASECLIQCKATCMCRRNMLLEVAMVARMLMWEDEFCQGRSASLVEDMDGGGEDLVRKTFSKMSIQLYNYGEGWVLGRSLFCENLHVVFLLNGPTSLILAFRLVAGANVVTVTELHCRQASPLFYHQVLYLCSTCDAPVVVVVVLAQP
ncbi:hypothetical protein AHAS_Ahas10G0088100 [Arachis hypogaea]